MRPVRRNQLQRSASIAGGSRWRNGVENVAVGLAFWFMAAIVFGLIG